MRTLGIILIILIWFVVALLIFYVGAGLLTDWQTELLSGAL